MAETNPLRYRGYYYDIETGFYYLQSRYYDPANYRFINADSIVSTGQGFTGTNMFAYCNNCPVIYSDHSGHISKYSSVALFEGGGGAVAFNGVTSEILDVYGIIPSAGFSVTYYMSSGDGWTYGKANIEWKTNNYQYLFPANRQGGCVYE